MRLKISVTLMMLLGFVVSNAGIMVFPKYVFLDEKNKSENVFLVNSNETEESKYRITLKDFKQNSDGAVNESPVDADPLFKALRFSPRRADLEPKKQQTIKLLVKDFKALPEGDSIIYLAISKVPSPDEVNSEKMESGNISILLTPIHEVAIPIVVRKGRTNDKGYLSNISKSADFAKNPALTMRLNRVADSALPNGVVRGDISVWYKNELLGFLKGKYLMPDLKYTEITLPIKDISAQRKKENGADITVLFTKYEDGNSIDKKRIIDERVFKL